MHCQLPRWPRVQRHCLAVRPARVVRQFQRLMSLPLLDSVWPRLAHKTPFRRWLLAGLTHLAKRRPPVCDQRW